MRNIAYTSSLAYASIDNLGAKQLEVLEKIREIGPCSNKQIAKSLGWEINRVTGRVSELHDKGLVRFAGIQINEIGKSEKIWVVKEE